MTKNESNPESSAATAMSVIRSNSRSFGTSGKLKLGSWRPNRIMWFLLRGFGREGPV